MEQGVKKRVVSEIIEVGDRVRLVDVSDLPPQWKLIPGMTGTVHHKRNDKGSRHSISYVDFGKLPVKFIDSNLVPLSDARLEIT